MKLLIVSDTHGSFRELNEVIRRESPMDHLIHCGDLCAQAKVLREMAPCPVTAVSGNCDYSAALREELILELSGHRILVTHGHLHHVKRDLFELAAYAQSVSCDIVTFGHTHIPEMIQMEDVLLINPGSLRYPRGRYCKPSYAVLTLADYKTESACEILYLPGA